LLTGRRAQLLLQGELKCEARQEGTVEQAATAGLKLKQTGANKTMHAAVVSILSRKIQVTYHIRHYIRARV
jgi:hypothetical protein